MAPLDDREWHTAVLKPELRPSLREREAMASKPGSLPHSRHYTQQSHVMIVILPDSACPIQGLLEVALQD